MDPWFREIHVPRVWRVYLATGLEFSENNGACFGSIGTRVCRQRPTLPLYYGGTEKKTIFPQDPGGYSCGAAPHTLTLFKTNIADLRQNSDF